MITFGPLVGVGFQKVGKIHQVEQDPVAGRCGAVGGAFVRTGPSFLEYEPGQNYSAGYIGIVGGTALDSIGNSDLKWVMDRPGDCAVQHWSSSVLFWPFVVLLLMSWRSMIGRALWNHVSSLADVGARADSHVCR